MKLLVTGASGGLGRIIIPKLLELGHQVIATSRSVEKAKQLDFYDKVTFIPFDINDTSTSLNLFDYFQKPDSLIHLAWEKLNEYKSEDHITSILENQKSFVFNLISNGLKDFNGVGTCYEYGMTEGELNENLPSNADLPYPKGKNLLREFVENLHLQYQFTHKWIRVFYVFGEIYGRKNLYTMLRQAILEKQTSFDMSGGEQIRDFLSPEQIGDLIIKISLQTAVTGIINCCSGQPVKLKDYIMSYLKTQNTALQLNLGVFPYAPYEPMNSWGSVEKLNKIIHRN